MQIPSLRTNATEITTRAHSAPVLVSSVLQIIPVCPEFTPRRPLFIWMSCEPTTLYTRANRSRAAEPFDPNHTLQGCFSDFELRDHDRKSPRDALLLSIATISVCNANLSYARTVLVVADLVPSVIGCWSTWESVAAKPHCFATSISHHGCEVSAIFGSLSMVQE